MCGGERGGKEKRVKKENSSKRVLVMHKIILKNN
jgi:hypothetical protein